MMAVSLRSHARRIAQDNGPSPDSGMKSFGSPPAAISCFTSSKVPS